MDAPRSRTVFRQHCGLHTFSRNHANSYPGVSISWRMRRPRLLSLASCILALTLTGCLGQDSASPTPEATPTGSDDDRTDVPTSARIVTRLYSERQGFDRAGARDPVALRVGETDVVTYRVDRNDPEADRIRIDITLPPGVRLESGSLHYDGPLPAEGLNMTTSLRAMETGEGELTTTNVLPLHDVPFQGPRILYAVTD